jgi:hypothetical protein
MAELQKVISDDVKDHYESQIKSANYLLVAHAAGLIGCLSVLKDYATTPQLKGMGIFIILFGIGLLGAILNYVSIAFGVLIATSSPKPGSRSYRTAIDVTLLGAAGGLAGLALLVVAIVIIIARFSSL